MGLPDLFFSRNLGGVPAVVALIILGIKHHLVVADRADHAGTGAHVTALQAVVEPAVLVDVQEYIASAARAAFCFPFRHCFLQFKPGQSSRPGEIINDSV
jgi:hypothetical protein